MVEEDPAFPLLGCWSFFSPPSLISDLLLLEIHNSVSLFKPGTIIQQKLIFQRCLGYTLFNKFPLVVRAFVDFFPVFLVFNPRKNEKEKWEKKKRKLPGKKKFGEEFFNTPQVERELYTRRPPKFLTNESKPITQEGNLDDYSGFKRSTSNNKKNDKWTPRNRGEMDVFYIHTYFQEGSRCLTLYSSVWKLNT